MAVMRSQRKWTVIRILLVPLVLYVVWHQLSSGGSSSPRKADAPRPVTSARPSASPSARPTLPLLNTGPAQAPQGVLHTVAPNLIEPRLRQITLLLASYPNIDGPGPTLERLRPLVGDSAWQTVFDRWKPDWTNEPEYRALGQITTPVQLVSSSSNVRSYRWDLQQKLVYAGGAPASVAWSVSYRVTQIIHGGWEVTDIDIKRQG